VLLSHGFDNNAPLTRHHFYAEAETETKPQAARIRALEPA
jgi:hypothetical protein